MHNIIFFESSCIEPNSPGFVIVEKLISMTTKQNVKDKTIIITGGSSGIGAAAAKQLTKQGARVIITGRSAETMRLARELGCDGYLVDYCNFDDVRNFATIILETYPRIDVLVNNVGGILKDRRVTPDGMEQTLQVNHLSGFLLTLLLKERLEESRALVINTSSMANMFGSVQFDALQSEKNYRPMKAYGTGKLMNILHAMEVSRRFRGVRAVSFHPGVVRTAFARESSGIFKWAYEATFKNWFMISPEQGADTLVWLIAGEGFDLLTPGEYYYKRKPGRKNPQVTDEMAHRLWAVSEKLVFS
jgi:NAD(P)-dependent dehydrogenase (short-subunit alcohol dehydrogenase family)